VTIRPVLRARGLLLLLAASCDAPPERFEFRELHMGTEARLVLYAPSPDVAERAAAAGFRRIAELDSLLSDYRPDSELSRLSAQAGAGPRPIGDDLFHLLARATETARLTDGAFDITMGPVVLLWREARRSGALPDSAVLDSARALVDWRLVTLDSAARTATLGRPGMRLDPGGIAKGYAADEALAAMRAEGIERALVAFGGEIVAGAPPPGSVGWGIELPDGDSLELAHAALASSGDAEQFVEIGGTRYSHVVDPRTGAGLSGGAGATVMARDGLTADALATAASVVERGVAAGWLTDTAVVGAGARLIRHAPVRPRP